MKTFQKVSMFTLTSMFLLGLIFGTNAATTVDLGTADNFAVLAGSTVTNTGASVITGDLGLSPGSSVTGFPPGTLVGTQHVADATAVQAKNDLTTAYNNAAGQTPATTVATELGGTTKTPGIYTSDATTFGITGTLTLDAQGDPDAVFIFQAGSTLTTASRSNVVLANGAQACHVFWQVGSSATLGTYSTFKGNIMAYAAITVTTGANVEGRMLAQVEAVTLDTNIITAATCAIPLETPVLHVIKNVVNNNGGTAVRSDFDINVKHNGNHVTGSPAPGVKTPGTLYALDAGTYVVSEKLNDSYDFVISGDCDSNGEVTLATGDDKTCTITNTDTPLAPITLRVIKNVVNNNGGTAVRSDFTMHVKHNGEDVTDSPAPGEKTPGTLYALDAGTYVVSENEDDSYTFSFSGDCDSNGNVSLVDGDHKTCTVTNTDTPLAPAPIPIPTPTPTPGFPKTGISPDNSNSQNVIILAGGFFMLVSSLLIIVLKKKMI